jgi:hypothetical protein
MVGTVRSRHRDVAQPTRVAFVGYLGNTAGERLNTRALRPLPELVEIPRVPVVLVIGTSMNAGKTTTARKLARSLLRLDRRVAVFKLTGSVSPLDHVEFSSTQPHFVADFSDYGIPSTYMLSAEELRRLFFAMLHDAAAHEPDVVVMEIADGVLQREVRMILADPAIRHQVEGVVLAAPCAASALWGVEQVRALGHEPIIVAGRITNSPLAVREYEAFGDVPVESSRASGAAMAQRVVARLGE